MAFGRRTVFTHPVGSSGRGLTGNADVALQAGQHRHASLGQCQTVAQQINEAAGQQLISNEVAASGRSAHHQITTQHLVRDHDAVGGALILLSSSLADFNLELSSATGRSVTGVGEVVQRTSKAERTGLLIGEANIVGGDVSRTNDLFHRLRAEFFEDGSAGLINGATTIDQLTSQVLHLVLLAQCIDGGDTGTLGLHGLGPDHLQIWSVFHFGFRCW